MRSENQSTRVAENKNKPKSGLQIQWVSNIIMRLSPVGELSV